MSDVNYPIVYDTSYTGGIDASGNLNQLWNADALNNAVMMWIASQEGEVFRKPTSGGYVTRFIGKPMGQVNISQFKMALRNGFDRDFQPYLKVITLNVIPHFEEKYWEIYMEYYSEDLKIYSTVSANIRNKA